MPSGSKCDFPKCNHRREICRVISKRRGGPSGRFWEEQIRSISPNYYLPNKNKIHLCECHLTEDKKIQTTSPLTPVASSAPITISSEALIHTLLKERVTLMKKVWLAERVLQHFTPSQIRLLEGNNVLEYDDKTIITAVNLRSTLGRENYEYVRSVLPPFLPSVRTVEKRIELIANGEPSEATSDETADDVALDDSDPTCEAASSSLIEGEIIDGVLRPVNRGIELIANGEPSHANSNVTTATVMITNSTADTTSLPIMEGEIIEGVLRTVDERIEIIANGEPPDASATVTTTTAVISNRTPEPSSLPIMEGEIIDGVFHFTNRIT